MLRARQSGRRMSTSSTPIAHAASDCGSEEREADVAAVAQLFERLRGLRPDEVPAEVELAELRAAAQHGAHDGEAAPVVQLDVPLVRVRVRG